MLFRDVRWLKGSAIMSKCCQPHPLLARIVIHYVVSARRTIQGSDRGVGRIVNVYPAPDSLSVADNRHLLLTHLFSHIAVGHEPGAWSVEESVPEDDGLELGSTKSHRFELGIALRTGGDGGGGAVGEAFAFGGQPLAGCIPESGGLHQEATHARLLRRRDQVLIAFQPHASVAFGRSFHIGGRVMFGE